MSIWRKGKHRPGPGRIPWINLVLRHGVVSYMDLGDGTGQFLVNGRPIEERLTPPAPTWGPVR